MARLLTEAQVTGLLTMQEALEAVEEAFRILGTAGGTCRPRVRLPVPEGLLHVMPAAAPTLGVMGLKAYATLRGTARFAILLFHTKTGRLLAVIEADRLGQMRTGAASGVATKHMARADAGTVGIYGTGWQARSQLQAVCAVRPIKRIKVYGRNPERRTSFAEEMSRLLTVEVTPVDRPEEVARGTQILITATNAKVPVLLGEWIEEGCHVNAIGSNSLQRVEIDAEVVRRASLVVVDSAEQARIECGDLVAPIEQGIITWEQIHELAEVVSGKLPGRRDDRQITLFESQGIAMEDVATAARVLSKAEAQGIGQIWEGTP